MMISENGLNFIKEFEGFSSIPYYCGGGFLTIGYGHMIRAGEILSSVSAEESLELLQKDVKAAESAVNRLIEYPMTQNQFDALGSFTFNLGAGALQRSALRRKMNRGDLFEVPDEFLKWVKAAGRVLPGLVRRRLCERHLFLCEV